MRLKSASGLTLVELLVVVLFLGILSMALFPAGTDPLVPNMWAVGVRGKDINGQDSVRRDFKNSTDYFKWLLGGHDGALPGWNPQAGELDYRKLAGAGVMPCATNGSLTAENNLWTVAVSVRDDMDDSVPILITRNIDASSLASRTTEQSLKTKSLRFDPAWKTLLAARAMS